MLERKTQDTQGLVIDRAELREAPDRLEGALNAKQDDLVRSCGEAALLVWRMLRSSDYPGKDEMSQPLRLRYTLADPALAPQGASADLAFTVMLLMDRLSAGHRTDEPQSLVAATGELFGTAKQLQDGYRNPLLEVRAVGGVPAKVQAALDYFEQHGQAQSGRILVPQGNLAELEKVGLGDKVRQGVIVPVRQLQDVLDALRQLPLLPQRLRQILQELRAPFSGNPFQGLLAFDIEHRAQYFGRDTAVDEVLKHLPSDPGAKYLPGVLITGYSGSGKSSLMKAGVLGRVLYTAPKGYRFLPQPQALTATRRPVWRVPALSSPTEAEWAKSLALHWQGWLPNCVLPQDRLAELGRALGERLREESGHWILAIDQMEELVSQTVQSASPEVDGLLRQLDGCLVQLEQAGVWLLATVREEYASRLKRTLRQSFPEQIELDAPDDREHQQFLFEVIDKPCQLADVGREPALLDALRTDAKDPASVPLLQYALNELYGMAQAQQAASNQTPPPPTRLTQADYEAMGRLQGAINRTAQRLLKDRPLQASQVLGLLGRMARKALGSTAAQRGYVRAPLSASAQEAELLEPWIQARLVVRTQEHLEVAHEAVLNHFTALTDWLRQHDELLQWRQEHLLPQRAKWLDTQQDEAWLLQERDLLDARRASDQEGVLGAQEREYVRLSEQHIERSKQEQAQEEERRLQEMEAKNQELERRKAEVEAANHELEQAAEQIAKQNQTLSQTNQELDDAAVKLNQRNRRLKLGAWILLGLSILALWAGWQAWKGKQKADRRTLESLALRWTNEVDADTSHSALLRRTLALRVLPHDAVTSDSILNAMQAIARQGLFEISQSRAHTRAVTSVAFSPDGTRVVSGSADATLRLWDAQTGQPIGEPMRGHTDGVTSVAFSPDGNRVVSGSDDNTLRLWDAQTGRPIGEPMRGHTDRVTSVAFSPDGRRVVSGSGSLDNTLRLWDAQTGRAIGEPKRGHTDLVASVAFSPDGRRVVSGSWDTTLRLWDAQAGRPIGEPMRGHTDRVTSVAFSPDGRRVVSGSQDKTLRLWDAQTGRPIGEPMRGHTDRVTSVAFSPDGRRVVSGSQDNTLRLWDAQTGRPIGEPMRGHENEVTSVAFSPDGRRVVSGSVDYTLRLWDAQTGRPIGEPMQGHENGITSVAFSPDGTRVVSSSWDTTLRLWDAQTGRPIGEPMREIEHPVFNPVFSVAFSPDGRRVVSGSFGDSLRLRDTQTGRPIGEPMRGHENKVTSVAFSPDGRRVVSGSLDETLRLWLTASGMADWICERVGRNPTQAEIKEWGAEGLDLPLACPEFPPGK
ncbi:hypothetical protein LNV28_13300 [Paucibacter sp. DJ2R-2]|nr:hypothetical protein [Paucibacter sp. DJ2R-2]